MELDADAGDLHPGPEQLVGDQPQQPFADGFDERTGHHVDVDYDALRAGYRQHHEGGWVAMPLRPELAVAVVSITRIRAAPG